MARGAIQRAREFVRRRNEQARALMVQVRTDAETVGAAAAMGYARGRMPGSMSVGDVDLELIIGVAGKVVAYSGMLGRSASPDLHAISNGVLSSYAAMQAHELGEEHALQDGAAAQGVRGLGRGTVSPIGAARQRVAV